MHLAIVIPTRHRPDLAIAAIQSLLEARELDLTVIVSDNSTREEDVRKLAAFCSETTDARLLRIRPTEPLAMPAHWNWALEQALSRTGATHIAVHYDRKVTRPDGLAAFVAACMRNPDAITTYACDFTVRTDGESLAWMYPGTGKLYQIRTSRVVELSSQGVIHDMGQPIPLLSNCAVPRTILERVRERFGNICDSATPDISFTYRYCALEERYFHFDRAISVLYAFETSNGLSYYRQETKNSFGDYMALWGDRPWLEAAPIPGLNLGINVGFHEYNLVQRIVGTELFPPIDHDGYLREIARGLQYLKDPDVHASVRELLEKNGWREEIPPAGPGRLERLLTRIFRGVRSRLLRGSVTSEPLIDPGTLTFGDEPAAVGYLRTRPHAPRAENVLLRILEAVELGPPEGEAAR